MTTVFLAVGMAFAVERRQPWAALVVLVIGFAILWMLKARYKAVVRVDERTKRISEKAASATFWVFAVGTAVMIVVELILESIGIRIQQLKEVTEPLGYPTLGVIAIYAIFIRYYSRKM